MSGNRKQFAVSENRNELINDENKTSFIDLPKDTVQLLGSFIHDNTDKANFARLNKQTNNFFQPDLNKLAIKKLLHHVAYGEKDEAEKMLKWNPKLLLGTATVANEAGSILKDRTAYQIALMENDVTPFPEKFGEMAEMIEGCFDRLPNGEEKRQKQKNEQFPEGYEEEEEARHQCDNEAVKKVFDAIDKAQSDKEAEQAVEEFKQYLEKENKREFTTGYRFNEGIFTRALELHDQYYDRFGGFNSKKNNLAAVKVIGGIERYFPANLAQAMCDGIGKVVGEKQPLTRGKMMLNDKKTPFFDPNLGVSHFVYSYYVWTAGGAMGDVGLVFEVGAGMRVDVVKTYVKQKQPPYQAAKYRY